MAPYMSVSTFFPKLLPTCIARDDQGGRFGQKNGGSFRGSNLPFVLETVNIFCITAPNFVNSGLSAGIRDLATRDRVIVHVLPACQIAAASRSNPKFQLTVDTRLVSPRYMSHNSVRNVILRCISQDP